MYHEDSPVLAPFLRSKGVACHRGPRELGYVTIDISWILREVRDIHPDVFVANLSVAGCYASRWARDAGIPSVACHRSDDPFHWCMVERFVCGPRKWAVSGMVCVSDHIGALVAARQPQFTQVCVAPSGVPIPERVAELGGSLRILYAGRLQQKQKRIMDLLNSMISLLELCPDATFTMLGDGPEKDDVTKLVDKSPCADRIAVKEAVMPWKVHAEMLKHNTVVLLSDYEGTPGAVMDAMACGLVPVCLDIPGGVRELVEHNKTGLLVRNRGSDFLSEMRQLAVDQGLRRRLAKSARKRVQRRYSLQTTADSWEGFLEGLSKSEGPSCRVPRVPPFLLLPSPLEGFGAEDRRRPGLRERFCMRLRKLVW